MIQNLNEELFSFIKKSPTGFHAVHELANYLTEAGFECLAEGNTWNLAEGGGAVAVQNMSSNYGTVTISGASTQTTWIAGGSSVGNFANGTNAAAYQNLASNDSCEPPPTVCVGPACGPFASR